MDVVNYKQLQAQRDLMSCGLTQESINAIKATTVVTHNGQQQVTAHSDMGRIQTNSPLKEMSKETSQDILNSLQQQFRDQQNMFSRFKQFSDQRITSLERQLASALETMKNMSNRINTMASNQQARAPHSSPKEMVAGVAQKETKTKAPSDIAIDRNGVSPNSVSIDKIFYCGER